MPAGLGGGEEGGEDGDAPDEEGTARVARPRREAAAGRGDRGRK